MQKPEDHSLEDRALGLAAIVYYAVMLVAFVVGLYGLFSLFWLATSAIERTSHLTRF